MQRPPIDQQVTFIYTRNLERTAGFYQHSLGLPLVLDQGSCRIFRVSQAAFLGCCYSESAPEQSEGIILTLATREVDAWYRYLQQKGVEFEKPPAHNPKFNIYHCFLRDPNGYLIEIQEFLDPAWPA